MIVFQYFQTNVILKPLYYMTVIRKIAKYCKGTYVHILTTLPSGANERLFKRYSLFVLRLRSHKKE
jgi:hypothetical protein